MEKTYESKDFIREYVIDDREGLNAAIKKCEIPETKIEEFDLNEQEKEFFNKKDEKFEKYHHLSRLIAVLRPLHAAVEVIIKCKTGEREFAVDGKKVKMNDVRKMIGYVRRAFRHLWGEATDEKLDVLMLRFIQIADRINVHDLHVFAMITTDYKKLFFFLLVILSEILKILIYKLENASDEELKLYDDWIAKAANQLLKIVKNPLFQVLIVSLSSGGIAVVGAPLGLAALGFTVTGIQAGSIAAAWMSMLGSFLNCFADKKGTVGSGSLFAALQSAGAVGIGGLATGGLAIGGVLIGLSIFGIVKLATREKLIDVEIFVRGTSKTNRPVVLECSTKMKIEYFLLERLIEEIPIPDSIQELGVQICKENKKTSKLTCTPIKDLKKPIDDIGNFIEGYSLIIFDKSKGIYSRDDLPFYLERKPNCRGLWTIKQTPIAVDWN